MQSIPVRAIQYRFHQNPTNPAVGVWMVWGGLGLKMYYLETFLCCIYKYQIILSNYSMWSYSIYVMSIYKKLLSSKILKTWKTCNSFLKNVNTYCGETFTSWLMIYFLKTIGLKWTDFTKYQCCTFPLKSYTLQHFIFALNPIHDLIKTC